MVDPRPVDDHHIFLLDTHATIPARVRKLKISLTMTGRPPFLIAVVDDDQGILRSLEYLLESADYAVRLFASASELLDSPWLPELDCLISDVDMPGTDGFELVRLIRSSRPELAIILITGYPDRLAHLPPLGGSELRLFTKPFQGDELLQAVSAALANARK